MTSRCSCACSPELALLQDTVAGLQRTVRELQSLLRDRVAAPAATPDPQAVRRRAAAAAGRRGGAGAGRLPGLVVTRGDDRLLALDGRTGGHFPQTADGAYAGHHPLDSAHAIDELERMRAAGWRYLVFPVTALWWLDHYAELRRHLETTGRLLLRSEGLGVVYGLLAPADPAASTPASTPRPPHRPRSPDEQPRPLRRPPPPVGHGGGRGDLRPGAVRAGARQRPGLGAAAAGRDRPVRVRPRDPAPRHAHRAGRRRPRPVLLPHRRGRLRLVPVQRAEQGVLHALPGRLPARLQARRRAHPAQPVLRLRPGAHRPQRAAARRDRLHAARVPADVLPRRAAAHDQRLAVHRPEPAQVRLVLPRHRAAGVLPARALHQGAAGRGRPLRLPERLPARGVRRLGHPAREARARAERPAARRAGAAAAPAGG
jgi:hypothetical protein